MGRIKQPANSKGSLRNIQLLINKYPHIIDKKINDLLNSKESIEWISPLKEDDYSEYRDSDFLKNLGLGNLANELSNFWPLKGPQWDGLGKSEDRYFLIEAKANLPEMISSPCGAKGEKSLNLINSALNRTKLYISEKPITSNWTLKYYQYTNRLSHLYFLREKGINAYLIFLYFIGDLEVKGPETINDWMIAKKHMEESLQIPENHKLTEYILDIYVDINELKDFEGDTRHFN